MATNLVPLSPEIGARLSWARRSTGPLALVTSLIVFVALWEAVSRFSGLPSYMIPSPGEVLTSLVAGLTKAPASRDSFYYHLFDTLTATLFGFTVGSISGIAIGSLIVEFRMVERIALPYISALQALPKIAFAPLFIIWFGIGILSKVAMSGLISFFPPLVNTIVGLRSVEKDQLELMQSLGASRWKVFTAVKFPTALPFVFASLELGIVYALLGVIVSEFVASERGIGLLITKQESVANTAGVFAILVILGFTAAILTAIIRMIGRRVMFWRIRSDA